jgi:hypothetical protein
LIPRGRLSAPAPLLTRGAKNAIIERIGDRHAWGISQLERFEGKV